MTVTTTLSEIRKYHPCKEGWEKLLTNLGKTKDDNDPLEMTRILESNGLEDALWCLRALGPEHHKIIVSLACDFAERVLKFVPEGELRPAKCLRITRLWVDGKVTIEDVRNIADAAYVAYAVYVAADAADAARAAYAAYVAAYAAYVVADAVADAADAARAADAAEREWQEARFIAVMTTTQH